MNNIVLWKENSLLDHDQSIIWLKNELMSPRWMAEEVVKLLEQHYITDYKIIISENSIMECSDYISSLKENYVIIVHPDHLCHDSLLRHVQFTSSDQYTIPFLISDTILNFVDIANQNANKIILFYSLVANLTRETEQLSIPSNLIFKNFNLGNLCHKATEFDKSPVVTTKFKNTKTFVCLNNTSRPHRMATVSYLLADDLDKHGYISCINSELDPTAECFLDWCFDELHIPIATKIKKGIANFDHDKLLELPYTQHGYYLTNYDEILSALYHYTFIDIITDTTFFEPSALLNDKYVNSILGANFPIFISSCGTVELLRQLGFDVFDDVIDHSYDTIVDPAVRLSQAIELNKHLLVDIELINQLWYKHIDRFKQNQHYFKNAFKKTGENILMTVLKSGVAKIKRS